MSLSSLESLAAAMNQRDIVGSWTSKTEETCTIQHPPPRDVQVVLRLPDTLSRVIGVARANFGEFDISAQSFALTHTTDKGGGLPTETRGSYGKGVELRVSSQHTPRLTKKVPS